jgi:hypothetical protein
MRTLAPIATAALLLFASGGLAHGSGWTFRNGEELPGDPGKFDPLAKTITITNPLTGQNRTIPVESLSLRSRQRLLLSPVFNKGETGEVIWSAEKRRIILVALFIPALTLFLGFWVAAVLFAGKWNPLPAVIAFPGSWAVIGIFAICYAFLQMRLGGGMRTNLIGVGFAALFAPMFISAVYNCTFGKANLIFYFHLIAGLSLLSIGMVSVELIAGEKRLDEWWTRHVFDPMGLTGSPDAIPSPPATETGSGAN